MRGTLKLSAADWCFLKGDQDAASYYAKIKDLGYDAVEMPATGNYAAIKKLGMKILNTETPGSELGGLSKLNCHAELIPAIGEIIRKAGDNGIRDVIVFSGNREGQTDAQGIQNVKIGLERLLPLAEKNKVTLVFEMFCAHNHVDYQADYSEYGFKLVRSINSNHLKVLYDIYHMHRMGEDVIADVTGNLDIIAHLHIAGAPKRDYPGKEQEINYTKIVPAIIKAGYTGYWGMEFMPAGDSVAALTQAAAQWESLA